MNWLKPDHPYRLRYIWAGDGNVYYDYFKTHDEARVAMRKMKREEIYTDFIIEELKPAFVRILIRNYQRSSTLEAAIRFHQGIKVDGLIQRYIAYNGDMTVEIPTHKWEWFQNVLDTARIVYEIL